MAMSAFADMTIRCRGCCPELCVRSSGTETSSDDVTQDTEIQYVNSAALPVTNEKHEVYQDLNIGANSAEPIVYETIKPRVLPKPARHSQATA